MIKTPKYKKYECSICHQKYTEIEEMRTHIKRSHLVHVTCPLCDKIFPNVIQLEDHKKNHWNIISNSLIEQENEQEVHIEKEEDGYIKNSDEKYKNEDGESSRSLCKTTDDEVNSLNIKSHGILEQKKKEDGETKTPEEKGDGEVSPSPLKTIVDEITIPFIDTDSGKEILNNPTLCHPKESEVSDKEVATPNAQYSSLDVDDVLYYIIPFKETIYVDFPQHETDSSLLLNTTQKGFSKKDDSYHSSTYREIGNETAIIDTSTDSGAEHSPSEPEEYTCNICKKKYDIIEDVWSHIKKTHFTHLICPLCNESFPNRSQYLSHSYIHLNNSLNDSLVEEKAKENKIEDLGKNLKENIGKNKNSATDKEAVGSGECNKRKSSCNKSKEYKCSVCNNKYTCVEDVRTHVKQVHLANLTCQLCYKIFANKLLLQEHARLHFNATSDSTLEPEERDNAGKCSEVKDMPVHESSGSAAELHSECDANATNRHEPESDVLSCVPEHSKCIQCGLYFDTEIMLDLHKKSHQNVMYKCGICPYASSLRDHVLNHLSQEHQSFQIPFKESALSYF